MTKHCTKFKAWYMYVFVGFWRFSYPRKMKFCKFFKKLPNKFPILRGPTQVLRSNWVQCKPGILGWGFNSKYSSNSGLFSEKVGLEKHAFSRVMLQSKRNVKEYQSILQPQCMYITTWQKKLRQRQKWKLCKNVY